MLVTVSDAVPVLVPVDCGLTLAVPVPLLDPVPEAVGDGDADGVAEVVWVVDKLPLPVRDALELPVPLLLPLLVPVLEPEAVWVPASARHDASRRLRQSRLTRGRAQNG